MMGKEKPENFKRLKCYLKVVQIKGRYKDIVLEAYQPAQFGADIVFIDTGKPSDVTMVVERIVQLVLRKQVNIAFGGGSFGFVRASLT